MEHFRKSNRNEKVESSGMFHFDFLKFEIKNRTLSDTGEVTLFDKNRG